MDKTLSSRSKRESKTGEPGSSMTEELTLSEWSQEETSLCLTKMVRALLLERTLQWEDGKTHQIRKLTSRRQLSTAKTGNAWLHMVTWTRTTLFSLGGTVTKTNLNSGKEKELNLKRQQRERSGTHHSNSPLEKESNRDSSSDPSNPTEQSLLPRLRVVSETGEPSSSGTEDPTLSDLIPTETWLFPTKLEKDVRSARMLPSEHLETNQTSSSPSTRTRFRPSKEERSVWLHTTTKTRTTNCLPGGTATRIQLRAGRSPSFLRRLEKQDLFKEPKDQQKCLRAKSQDSAIEL